jgi:hypothetical protein
MATSSKAEIQARIDGIMQRLSTYTRKTPEYQAAVQRLNDSLKLLGKPPVLANDLPDKSGYIAGRTPANVGSAPAAAAPVAPTAPDGGIPDPTVTNANDQKSLTANEIAMAEWEAANNVKLGTAGTQKNPYGQQTITRDPVTGEITQETKLSDDQQKILDQGESLTQTGQGLAQGTLNQFQAGFDPNLTARMTTGDLNADRARIEGEVFGRLTRGLDAQKANENQAMEQTLRNRGIPLGSKQWNDQMAEFNKRYDTLNADARAQAAQMGGDEFSRSFGIGEQLRANEYSEQSNARNQNLGEASALQGMGSGLMTPEFTGYQGTALDTTAPTDIYGTVKSVKQNKTALDIQREQIQAEKDMQAKALAQQKALSGGGGGGGATTSSPFQP